MATTTTKRPRRDTLNIRIKPDERGLIDRAAELAGKTCTDFVLEAARRAAIETLTERTLYQVDPEHICQIPGSTRCTAPPQRQASPHDADACSMGSQVSVAAPVLLDASHDFAAFDCGATTARRVAGETCTQQCGERRIAYLYCRRRQPGGWLLRACSRRRTGDSRTRTVPPQYARSNPRDCARPIGDRP